VALQYALWYAATQEKGQQVKSSMKRWSNRKILEQTNFVHEDGWITHWSSL